MNLVPVQMYPRRGYWVVLCNIAMGHVAWIHCLYVVGRFKKSRQAKKIAAALNDAMEALECGEYFSYFRAEVLPGEFPVGAKMIDAPLRRASRNVAQEWVTQYLPPPIQATEYDEDAWYQSNHSVVQKYGTFNPALDGAPCSVQ